MNNKLKRGQCCVSLTGLIAIVTLILVIGFVSMPVFSAQDNNNDNLGSGSDSDSTDNSDDDSDEEDTEIRERTRVEIKDGETRIRGEREVRGPDGERIRERFEIRERTRLNDSERSEILRTEHRLRVGSGSDIDVPENCERRGVVVRCELENGTREMTVHASSGNVIVIKSGETNATTNVTLYHHDGRVFANFQDNETKEIILPDEARLRVKERMRTQIEDENLTLTNEGEYLLEARKRARLIGLFEVEGKVRANIDAETGEILRQRVPWWSFLAFEVESDVQTETNSTNSTE